MKDLEIKGNSIKYWAEDDRPREKFINKGRTSLSNAELLAIQLASGNRKDSALDLAKKILVSVDNNLAKLSKLSLEELMMFNGVGVAKAVNILSALELGRRKKGEDNSIKEKINSSKLVYDSMRPFMLDLEHEEFWCMFLNSGNNIIKIEKMSTGGINSTLVDKRKILKRALVLAAPSIIIAHNHPSGNSKPSHQDINLTKSINKAAELLDIQLLDHIIVCDSKYFSFADEGIL